MPAQPASDRKIKGKQAPSVPSARAAARTLSPALSLPLLAVGAGLFLLSAASLAFEVTLTHLFSLVFQYHFAFLAVSCAILGLGAGAAIGALLPIETIDFKANAIPGTYQGAVRLENSKFLRASAGSAFRLPHCHGIMLGQGLEAPVQRQSTACGQALITGGHFTHDRPLTSPHWRFISKASSSIAGLSHRMRPAQA